MTEVLQTFYWIITTTATWFMNLVVESNVTLGQIIIAFILSGMAATYIIMSAKFRNSRNYNNE